MLIDVHAHLDFPQFDSDREHVIECAREAGIIIVNSGMGPSSIEKTLDLARNHDNVFATLGLSPQEFNQETIENTLALIRKHRADILGIGEVGLDYYWVKDSSDRRREIVNLGLFIELSKSLSLPLVIHSRDAEGDVLKVLEENDVRALLHCFSGSFEQAEVAISLDCLISIPTSVVYSKNKQGLVERLPLESIVLETDAPYLSPHPKMRNEPKNIILSRDKVAEIKGLDKHAVEETTTENAIRFFDLKVSVT
jgi:TatD DNase family protein